MDPNLTNTFDILWRTNTQGIGSDVAGWLDSHKWRYNSTSFPQPTITW